MFTVRECVEKYDMFKASQWFHDPQYAKIVTKQHDPKFVNAWNINYEELEVIKHGVDEQGVIYDSRGVYILDTSGPDPKMFYMTDGNYILRPLYYTGINTSKKFKIVGELTFKNDYKEIK